MVRRGRQQPAEVTVDTTTRARLLQPRYRSCLEASRRLMRGLMQTNPRPAAQTARYGRDGPVLQSPLPARNMGRRLGDLVRDQTPCGRSHRAACGGHAAPQPFGPPSRLTTGLSRGVLLALVGDLAQERSAHRQTRDGVAPLICTVPRRPVELPETTAVLPTSVDRFQMLA